MTQYQQKDIRKFSQCNKLITRGVAGSSSNRYRTSNSFGIALEDINTPHYDCTDIVGVSVNGDRQGRLMFNSELVLKALNEGAKIVTDNNFHRNRKFNIGERELASMLNLYKVSYAENDTLGVWQMIKLSPDEWLAERVDGVTRSDYLEAKWIALGYAQEPNFDIEAVYASEYEDYCNSPAELKEL